MNISLLEKKASDFTNVYSNYYALVYSMVFTKVDNHDEAEDICQEVFLRFYEKFDEVLDPRKWLYGTLRNVVLEHYRKKGRNDANIDDIFQNITMSFVNGFRDTRIIIEEALDNTENFEDESERVVFDLVALYNFSYAEAAQQMGMTERQVRYRYAKVSERITHYLKKKGISSLEELL